MAGVRNVVLIAVACGLMGCATTHRPKGESWDQENLKRNDHGCPTAVYIAPGGDLTQCMLKEPK